MAEKKFMTLPKSEVEVVSRWDLDIARKPGFLGLIIEDLGNEWLIQNYGHCDSAHAAAFRHEALHD